MNVSTTLVFEYEEILKREKEQIGFSDQKINNIIEAICAIANRYSIFYLWRPIARDPDDDFLIDLAIECQANFIITYNQKDLQAAQKFGIKIVSPKEFWFFSI